MEGWVSNKITTKWHKVVGGDNLLWMILKLQIFSQTDKNC